MQCDHLKGVRTATDLTPRVHSLSANAELVTAIANDLSYENVFVYQLQSQAEPDDVLIAISSSWRSANILNALTWARDYGLRTIAITGFDGGASRTLAEVNIHVECTNYGVVEDLGQAVMHALAQYCWPRRLTSGPVGSWPSGRACLGLAGGAGRAAAAHRHAPGDPEAILVLDSSLVGSECIKASSRRSCVGRMSYQARAHLPAGALGGRL